MRNTGFIFLLFLSLFCDANDTSPENFDRLFTSHAERQKLDDLRRQGQLYKEPLSAMETLPSDKLVTKKNELKVSGIILRADGKAQIWLSGQPLYSSLKQFNSSKDKSSNLRIPIAGYGVSLQPGQVLSSGKIKESYFFVLSQSSEKPFEKSFNSILSAPTNSSSNTSSSGSSQESSHGKSSAH